MVNITTTDVLTEQRIRRVVEEEREYPLIWNQAFRTINMPDDHSSRTMEIPQDEAVMSMPDRIQEGSEFPRTEEGIETTKVTVEKHGFEIKVSWEATEFSVFDVVARQTEKAASRFNQYINQLAYNFISDTANQHPSSPVDLGNSNIDSSEFGFELATYAEKLMKDDQLNPDMLVVNTQGEYDVKNSDNFQRASDLGDEMTREGAIGRFAGVDVMVDNSGLMSDSSAEGYLIDADEYGYEVVKEDVSTEEYYDQSRQSQIVQWFTMRNWHVIDAEAVIKIQES
jgi:hypothetical protein